MKNVSGTYRGWFGVVTRHPRLIIAIALVMSALSLFYTRERMQFLTGRDDLMPKSTKFHRDYREWRQEFGDMEDIVVVMEGEDPERVARFGSRLYADLRKEEQQVREVFYPYGLKFFQENALLFMPLSDLQSLRQNLTMAAPVLKELTASPSVQTLFTYLTSDIDRYLARGDASPGGKERLARLTFMLDKLGAGFNKFGGAAPASFSLNDFFLGSGDGKESRLSQSGRLQVLTVLPVRDDASFVPAEKTIALVRSKVAALRQLPEFKGVTVGLTGTPVLEYEEMSTSQRDITLATILSLSLTVVLLLLAFRGVLNVLAAMVTLLVAIAVSFGAATLVVGHLNILSMVFAVMLIGIGIEYGIQVVLRYQEELSRGEGEFPAIETALNKNLWAIVMAASTTAAAFLTFVFTDFKGIVELGIIAGIGVVICVLATFTVLPAMLVLLARFRKAGTAGSANGPVRRGLLSRFFTERAKRVLFGSPKAVLAVTVLLCVASLYPLTHISFDYNLMNLQARGLESVSYAYKLMRNSENSGYFAVVTAKTAADAAEKSRRLEALPTVDHVVSLNSFVPDDQEQKLAELRAMRELLAGVKPAPYEENLNAMALPTVFENFHGAVERLKVKLEEEKRPEAGKVSAFLTILDRFFATLEKEKDKNALGMLRDFQGGMFAELPEKIGFLKASLNAAPVSGADIPAELRERFVGKTGKYLLQVAPKHEIFDRDPLKAFIDDVRRVDANVTGEPVMVYESMTIMRDAYRGTFIYALLAVILILLVTFRSLKFAAIGLVPLVVGVLLMVSGMYLFGISFNSANIIIMPLVLGIAIDSGIYIINRFRREGESGVEVVTRSTGLGVIYNALTIVASFGALMVAHHRGVFSIGGVMSLGMVACLAAFILVLPAVLALVRQR